VNRPELIIGLWAGSLFAVIIGLIVWAGNTWFVIVTLLVVMVLALVCGAIVAMLQRRMKYKVEVAEAPWRG
jgi:uncharacterized membrane protein YczE